MEDIIPSMEDKVEGMDHVSTVVEQWGAERPELDVSPLLVIGRIHRIALALTPELVEVYARHGLGEGDFDVLATLRRQGAPYALTPGELGERTMVTSGAVTKRVDRLAAKGLVERRASTTDGRSRTVVLTSRGPPRHRRGDGRARGQRGPVARRSRARGTHRPGRTCSAGWRRRSACDATAVYCVTPVLAPGPAAPVRGSAYR